MVIFEYNYFQLSIEVANSSCEFKILVFFSSFLSVHESTHILSIGPLNQFSMAKTIFVMVLMIVVMLYFVDVKNIFGVTLSPAAETNHTKGSGFRNSFPVEAKKEQAKLKLLRKFKNKTENNFLKNKLSINMLKIKQQNINNEEVIKQIKQFGSKNNSTNLILKKKKRAIALNVGSVEGNYNKNASSFTKLVNSSNIVYPKCYTKNCDAVFRSLPVSRFGGSKTLKLDSNSKPTVSVSDPDTESDYSLNKK